MDFEHQVLEDIYGRQYSIAFLFPIETSFSRGSQTDTP